jgi:hypothetical protein
MSRRWPYWFFIQYHRKPLNAKQLQTLATLSSLNAYDAIDAETATAAGGLREDLFRF